MAGTTYRREYTRTDEVGVYPVKHQYLVIIHTMKTIVQLMAVCLVAAALATACKPRPQQRADATQPVSDAQPVFQISLVLDTPSADSEQMTFPTKNGVNTHTEAVNVQKTVLLDQTALQSAKASTDALGHPVIEINFTDDGRGRFAELTRQNIGKRLAILIDGRLYMAPVVQTEISGGKAQISGSFSNQEARDLAAKLNASLRR
jgi:preprotein translocase subunit SecD